MSRIRGFEVLLLAVTFSTYPGGCVWNTAGSATAPSGNSSSHLRENRGPLITGTVSLDGVPVEVFGVSIVPHHLLHSPRAPFAGTERRGYFEADATPGRWDIVVAGPGFGRHVVHGVVVASGHTHLNIEVKRGYTIEGIVIDAAGQPVGGASVHLRQGPETPSRDPLWELSRGNFSGVTDSNGRFKFHDVISYRSGARLRAVIPDHSASVHHIVKNVDAFFSLVLRPVGTIVGDLVGIPVNDTIVIARSVSSPPALFESKSSADGKFEFTDIPVGVYDVGVLRISGSRGAILLERVAVVEGKTSTIVLKMTP